MTALAIILARAGSKGVPGKNVAPIAGKPCIAWTIEHAQQSQHVSRVVVSSDDPLVLDIAAAAGCEAIDRPADLAGDTATIDDAARHALNTTNQAAKHAGPIAILYANVPVRPADLTDRALDLLAATSADSVQSYAPVGKHHPWWTCRVDDAGLVTPWQGDTLNHGVYRRQDLPPAHIPDGGVIALTRPALTLELGVPTGPHAFLGRDRRGIQTREGEVIDIDARTDLLVADAILSERAQDKQATTPTITPATAPANRAG